MSSDNLWDEFLRFINILFSDLKTFFILMNYQLDSMRDWISNSSESRIGTMKFSIWLNEMRFVLKNTIFDPLHHSSISQQRIKLLYIHVKHSPLIIQLEHSIQFTAPPKKICLEWNPRCLPINKFYYSCGSSHVRSPRASKT